MDNNDGARPPQDIPSEAEEDHSLGEESNPMIQNSEEEGEDLMENMDADYRYIAELDQYEDVDIDDQQYDDMDLETRRLAELQIRERNNREQGGQMRVPTAIQEQDYDSEEDILRKEYVREKKRLEREQYREQDMEVEEDEEEDEDDFEKCLDKEEEKGNRHKWLKEARTIKFIRRKFRQFLMGYQKDGQLVYQNRIREMCVQNRQSVEVDYDDLMSYQTTLAMWVVEEPQVMLAYLNQVAFEVTLRLFKEYARIFGEIFVKMRNDDHNQILMYHIRDLRYPSLGKLLRVSGVVTRRSQVFSQMKMAYYVCVKCGDRKGPLYISSVQQQDISRILGSCAVCQSNGPFQVDEENTLYRNYQMLTIQEPPSQVSAGRVPRHKEIILLGDNIDQARPGDLIEVVGIFMNRYEYALNVKHGFPVFSSHIEANNIIKLQDIETTEITDVDQVAILQLAKQPDIGSRIINSIGPSIYGHHHTKTALALAMFGGQPKDNQGKHRIRGDINVLILGDPGCAKSQFLKFVEQTFPRAVFTTGKGASAVGLTASVLRDPQTREWVLEGGALVLADQGVCLIDEFDKMGENDRTSIHEAMEQQSISISKAGIVATLQARCSVIAAANPIKGRYDSQLSFNDNVDLTDPILSRFDILSVVKDNVNQDQDYDLASFVLNSHIKSHPHLMAAELSLQQHNTNQHTLEQHEIEILQNKGNKIKQAVLDERRQSYSNAIPQDMLRKYIIYARRKVFPKMQGIDRDKLVNFYTDLRHQAQISGGLHIAVRHLESVIRMAEAHARMHLREIVRNEDVDVAISVMMNSFIQSQKQTIARSIKKNFVHYLRVKGDSNDVLLNTLNEMVTEQLKYLKWMSPQTFAIDQLESVSLSRLQFQNEAAKLGISESEVQYYIINKHQ